MAPAASDAKPETPVLPKLGIPNGSKLSEDDMDSKLASPTDSDNAEKELASLESTMNGKLQINTEAEAKDPLINDAIFSAGAGHGNDSDPLSATALMSPIHTVNWESAAYFQRQQGSIDQIANFDLPAGVASANRWEAFKRTGPRYPPSLEKLILDYHHRNKGSWQLAHDMGAGSGIYSSILARYFRHVHISDPSAAGLATSRQALTSWSAGNKKSRGRFTFSAANAEQGHETFADRTVDLAIVMEGAHFTNAEAMVRSAAQSLSRDGTLAVVTYSPVCRITGNPRANDAAQRLFAAWGAQPWDVVCGNVDGQKQFSIGLDFVPLPADLFDQTKTRRITINTQNKGSAAFRVPTGPGADASDSRVHPNERRQDFSSENNDDQAKGWRQEVGPEFFRSMTAALVGGQAVQKFEKHFEEIQRIVYETSPNGLMITVEWTAAVVLATRK